jgi:rhodanese-related sulfurtransferase
MLTKASPRPDSSLHLAMDDLVSAQASARERSGGFVLPCGCGGMSAQASAGERVHGFGLPCGSGGGGMSARAWAGELASLRQRRLGR